jgi:AmmeMemoRadiSam system protein B
MGMLVAALLVTAGCKKPAPPPAPGEQERVEQETTPVETGAGEKFEADREVFWNQVAGRFYPGGAEELGKAVDGYIADAAPPPAAVRDADLLGFISPHAGYPYSGPVAGHGYSLLAGREISTVIVLGFSHKGVNQKSAVLRYDSYRTPLGSLPIDTQLVDRLLARGPEVLERSDAPFTQEHSLETQLPFVQKAVPGARIVPIMVGRPGGEIDLGLVDLLYAELGDRRDVVFVASTDLSHYEPYDQAVAKDKETLSRIASLDWGSLEVDGLSQGRMCGYYTVGVLLKLASRYGEDRAAGTRIKYLNSGDTAGDRDAGVVGYGVVAVTLPAGTRSSDGPGSEGPAASASTMAKALGPADRTALLAIARAAAEAAVKGASYKPAVAGSEPLEQVAYALVNIKVDGRPRGTGGGLDATGPLFEIVARAAQDAVAGDERYPPPREKDLATLECEVVVIYKSWPLADTETLDPASQGILVQAEDRLGYVLPGEGGWERKAALSQGCRRVGLSPYCWKLKKQDVVPTFSGFTGIRFADWDPGVGP